MNANLENLDPEELFIFKWQYRLLGDFGHALIKAILEADDHNLAKLRIGFPVEVGGYIKYAREPEWWKKVQKKALGDQSKD